MFTKEEEDKIGLIMIMYKENDTLRKNLEDKYDNNPSMLNPYEIYVLEVVYRYGNNNYFEQLIKLGNINEVGSIIKMFMDNCKNIPNFELEKVKDYYNNYDNLNDVEKFCIKLILKNSDKKRILENKMKYTYDDYVEIKLDTDENIRKAIVHMFFVKALSEFIKNKVDKELYNEIINRQIKPGMFASVDKYFLSAWLGDIKEIGEAIIDAAEKSFNDVKTDVENGNGLGLLSAQFGEGIDEVKINISFDDVYGDITKNNNKNM